MIQHGMFDTAFGFVSTGITIVAVAFVCIRVFPAFKKQIKEVSALFLIFALVSSLMTHGPKMKLPKTYIPSGSSHVEFNNDAEDIFTDGKIRHGMFDEKLENDNIDTIK